MFHGWMVTVFHGSDGDQCLKVVMLTLFMVLMVVMVTSVSW